MLQYAMRRRLRKALRIAPRHTAAPVMGFAMDAILERHAWIARSVLKHSPPGLELRGQAVCEVGAGDCLAASSLFLAQGAARVNIVEVEPAVVNEKQLQVLEGLQKLGLPMDLTIIQREGGLRLDAQRVRYHQGFMEDFHADTPHAFLFSFSVLEHVEDLAGFYASCWKALAPGGWMLHMIDLGGHELFEDPLPPLDFQTYPDWLYSLMFPKYHRATRRFVNEHAAAVTSAGFRVEKITPTRTADAEYLDRLWPLLRPAAQARPRDEIGVVEFALLAQKPA